MQTALKRLRPQEAYDRVFRLRRAFQVRPNQTFRTRQASLIYGSSPCPTSSCPRRSGPRLRMYEYRHYHQHQTLTMHKDTPYLSELITDIEAEMHEREDLEAMVIQKRQKNAAASSGH